MRQTIVVAELHDAVEQSEEELELAVAEKSTIPKETPETETEAPPDNGVFVQTTECAGASKVKVEHDVPTTPSTVTTNVGRSSLFNAKRHTILVDAVHAQLAAVSPFIREVGVMSVDAKLRPAIVSDAPPVRAEF